MQRGVLAFLLLALVAALLRLVFSTDLYGDEIEHAHVTWALGQGILPYRDLHQTHAPLLWLLCAPLLSALPEAPGSIVALRVLCTLAFLGTCVTTVLTLREVCPGASRAVGGLSLLVALAVVGQFELYRYRPDAFMTFFGSVAVCLLTRMGRAPAKSAFLAGVCFGIAASFSTKVAPVCVLLPLVAVVEALRSRGPRPLLTLLPHALGFLLGVAPVALWLLARGIHDDAFHALFVLTADMLSLGWDALATLGSPSVETLPFVLLAACGSGLLARDVWRRRSLAWSPGIVVLFAACLAWTIRSISPNHRDYNLAAMLLPGTIAATRAIVAVLRARSATLRVLALALLGVALLWRPLVVHGVQLRLTGTPVSKATLARLIELSAEGDRTCAGFSPFHPVFRRDATDVYMRWDLRLLRRDWLGDEGRRHYRGMWERAVDQIHDARPTLIVDANQWREARALGVLSEADHRRLMRLVATEYDTVELDGVVAIRRQTPFFDRRGRR